MTDNTMTKRTNNDVHTNKTKDQVMFRERAGRLL